MHRSFRRADRRHPLAADDRYTHDRRGAFLRRPRYRGGKHHSLSAAGALPLCQARGEYEHYVYAAYYVLHARVMQAAVNLQRSASVQMCVVFVVINSKYEHHSVTATGTLPLCQARGKIKEKKNFPLNFVKGSGVS